MVSALAYFIPNDRRLIDDFWKYIEHGLRKTNQDAVFRSAISCICDFATIYRELIADKVEPTLLQIMDLYGVSYYLYRRTTLPGNSNWKCSCV